MKGSVHFAFHLLLFLILPLSLWGCKEEKPALAPANLVVTIQVSEDGSGNVQVVATADNVDRYYINFGLSPNEAGTRSRDGIASTRYPATGTYTVRVTAYSPENVAAVFTEQIQVTVDIVAEGYVSPETYPGKRLVWRDEFNGTALNQADWVFETGTGSNGWGNNELQYYRPENTTVANGFLTITAKQESFGGRQYTSSRIKTQDRKTFTYGRFDIRAKLPEGQGIWPAIWMLGANIPQVSWPACGEIDIMEMIGGGPGRDNTVHGTVHYENNGHVYVGQSYTLPTGKASDKFHVYSIIWDATSITWLVDNVQFYTLNTSPAALSEFRNPFFILLNVAVGGNWPGSPNASTVFPQSMVVDYVRVFQD